MFGRWLGYKCCVSGCSVVPTLVLAKDVKDPQFDGVLVVQNADVPLVGPVQALNGTVDSHLKVIY